MVSSEDSSEESVKDVFAPLLSHVVGRRELFWYMGLSTGVLYNVASGFPSVND